MNALYPIYKEFLLGAQANWQGDDIRIALYDSLAVYNAAHTVIGDIAGTQIASGTRLTAMTVANGFAGSDPTEYNGLVNALDVAIAIIYRFSDGSLIAYLDQVNGFSFLPTGANYTLTPGGPGGTFFAL
jgi:hypothetical protein